MVVAKKHLSFSPIRLALAGILLVSFCPTAHSLDPKRIITQYSRHIWRVEDGLPYRTVRNIVQTPDGYLWLATQRGLARFDGVRFTVFDSNVGLAADWISTLLANDDGGLWIGTYGGGLSFYKEGRFKTYTIADGLPSTSVTALAKAGDILWIGTNEGLSRYQGGKFTTFNEDNGFANRYVRSLLVDRNGTTWIGTQSGIKLFENGRFLDSPQLEGLRTRAITSLHEDTSGKIWISTEGVGLASFWNGQIKIYSKRDGLSSNDIAATLMDFSGNLWIATYGGGLGRFKDEKFDAFTAENGFPGHNAIALFEDYEHNLWVGIENIGLMRLKDGDFTPFGIEEGLSDDQINAILEARDGSIWIGTNGAGLNRVYKGEVQVFGSSFDLGNNSIISLTETRDGSIWVGTRSEGLCQIRNGKIKRYTIKDGLNNNRVSVIYEDSRGLLWLGTGDGLNLLDKGKVSAFRRGDGQGSDQISSIAEGSDGSLWIGTFNGGLSRFQDGKFTSYKTPGGLQAAGVRGIYVDKGGGLWAARTDSGVVRFKDGRFTHFAGKDGLGTNPIYKILEDDYGQFWMTTSDGILRTSRKNLEDFADGTTESIETTSFNASDGMRNSGCASGFSSAIKARDGRLWFATVQGAVVVNPKNVETHRTIPPVIMEEFASDSSQEKSGTGIVVEPGHGDLEIRYTVLSFASPETLRFKYRLDGFDRYWTNVGNRRIAYYTNVPPGRYHFQVSAASSDGKLSDSATSISIYIKPHFYQTYWFYSLCGLTIVGCGFLLHALRVRQLQAAERELSKRVDEALADVKVLRGLLPTCASCKDIRDGDGGWIQMEAYVAKHSEAEFSHGICPKCAKQLYPDFF